MIPGKPDPASRASRPFAPEHGAAPVASRPDACHVCGDGAEGDGPTPWLCSFCGAVGEPEPVGGPP